MKLSETPDEQRQGHIAYIDKRWSQLSELEKEWSESAIKYLMFVNSGSAIAVLTFLGAIESVRAFAWPKVMLGFFVAGVVVLGAFQATRFHRIQNIYRAWRKGVNDYYGERLEWEELVNQDEKISTSFNPGVVLAYISFACFIGGVVVGLCNFSSLK